MSKQAATTMTTAAAGAAAASARLSPLPEALDAEVKDQEVDEDFKLSPTLGFAPRQYQIRIFREGKEKNIIAWIDTGGGKTLIAAMLISRCLYFAPPNFHEIEEECNEELKAEESCSGDEFDQFMQHLHKHDLLDSLVALFQNESQTESGRNLLFEQFQHFREKRGAPRSLRKLPLSRIFEDSKFNRRKCVFLVNKRVLGQQQSEALKRYLDPSVRISNYNGDMDVDFWDRSKWIKEFSDNDVLVMTSGIFLRILDHSYIHISHISMLVFDECHSARKNSHMNVIMRNHYDSCAVNERPKILGLTASPVQTGGKKLENAHMIALSMRELESNLDSKIIKVTRKEVEQVVSRPEENIRVFCAQSQESKELFELTYGRIVEICSDLPQEIFNEITKDVGIVLNELGAWAAAKHTIEAIRSFNRTHTHLSSEMKSKCIERLQQTLEAIRQVYFPEDSEIPPKPCISSQISSQLFDLVACLTEQRAVTPTLCGIIFVQKRITAVLLSKCLNAFFSSAPELHEQEYIDAINENSTESVQEVATQLGLVHLGNETKENQAIEVDTAPNELSEPIHYFSLSITGQDRVLNKTYTDKKDKVIDPVDLFRKGLVQILVSTSVLEEGIDIPSCKLVIRYNPMQSLVSFVQSRGRARHGNSKYIFMAEKGNLEERDLFYRMKNGENIMRQVDVQDCDQFSEDILEDMKKMFSKEEYVVPSTGAKVTLNSSVQLVHIFCSLLPRDKYSASFMKPTFSFEQVEGNLFVCTATLPLNSPVSTLQSDSEVSKTLAKQMVCLDICKQLHRCGALTDQLVPIITQRKFEEVPDESEKGSFDPCASSIGSYDLSLKGWQRTAIKSLRAINCMHMYRVVSTTNETVSMGLLSIIHLPEQYKLPFEVRDEVYEVSHEYIGSQYLNPDQLELCQIYFSTLLSAIWPSNYFDHLQSISAKILSPMLLVPIVSTLANPQTFSIDWSEVSRVLDANALMSSQTVEDLISAEGLESAKNVIKDHILISKHNKRRIKFVDIIPQADFTKILICDKKQGTNRPLSEIYSEFNGSSRASIQMNSKLNRHDLIVGSRAPSLKTVKIAHDPSRILTNNSVHRGYEIEVEEINDPNSNFTHLITTSMRANDLLEYLHFSRYMLVHPIHERVVSAGTAYGLVLWNNEQRLTVYSCMKTLFPGFNNVESLRISLATPSCQLESNYERYEMLGDSVLKLLATMYCLVKNPRSDEGQLTLLKGKIISNKHLFDCALKAGIPQFILSQSYTARKYLPIGLDEDFTMRTVSNSRDLSNKTIADVVEAIIGSYFLDQSDSLENVWRDVISRLGIIDKSEPFPFLDGLLEEPANRESTIDADEIALIEQLEQSIGYTFKNKYLALEALTHASFQDSLSQVAGRCYQRLEFLGDAVLDLIVTKFLFQWNDSMSSGDLTDWRSVCVNNNTLSLVSLKLGLCNMIRHCSEMLVDDIEFFKQSVQATHEMDSTSALLALDQLHQSGCSIRSEETILEAFREALSEEEVRTEWLSHHDRAPKVLGDVFEAVIGAIYLDSNGDMIDVNRLVHDHIISNILIRKIDNQSRKWDSHRHPVSIFEEIVSGSKCLSITLIVQKNEDLSDTSSQFVARVMFHDQLLLSSFGSNSRMAKMNVASNLFSLISPSKFLQFVKENCSCTH